MTRQHTSRKTERRAPRMALAVALIALGIALGYVAAEQNWLNLFLSGHADTDRAETTGLKGSARPDESEPLTMLSGITSDLIDRSSGRPAEVRRAEAGAERSTLAPATPAEVPPPHDPQSRPQPSPAVRAEQADPVEAAAGAIEAADFAQIASAPRASDTVPAEEAPAEEEDSVQAQIAPLPAAPSVESPTPSSKQPPVPPESAGEATAEAASDPSEVQFAAVFEAVRALAHAGIDWSPGPLPERSEALYRAQLTSRVRDREPVDTMGFVLNTEEFGGPIYYFTELRGLAGRTVEHRWSQEGKPAETVRMAVGSDRWRAYSAKSVKGRQGRWQVTVVDHRGVVLGGSRFVVR